MLAFSAPLSNSVFVFNRDTQDEQDENGIHTVHKWIHIGVLTVVAARGVKTIVFIVVQDVLPDCK